METNRTLEIPKNLMKAASGWLAAFLFSLPISAAPKSKAPPGAAPALAVGGVAGAWTRLESDLSLPVCRERMHTLSELKQLLELPAAQAFVLAPAATLKSPQTLELRKALLPWSSDLLIKVILDIDQRIASVCPNAARLLALRAVLQVSYLDKLGAKPPSTAAADNAFRAFIALKDDLPELKKKLAAVSMFPIERQPNALYGGADTVDGVIVLGAKPAEIKKLKVFLRRVCEPAARPCRFWDKRWLYKVVVVPDANVAAYLAELSVLILSRSLLAKDSVLNRAVLLHELSHSVVRRAEVGDGQPWTEDFARLSGWAHGADGKWGLAQPKTIGERNDAITSEAAESDFPFLPDPVFAPEAGRDGFVFAKSYRQTLEQNDPVEDLADHIAAFLLTPERFCFAGKPIAPAKYQWVGQKVFRKSLVLSCARKSAK